MTDALVASDEKSLNVRVCPREPCRSQPSSGFWVCWLCRPSWSSEGTDPADPSQRGRGPVPEHGGAGGQMGPPWVDVEWAQGHQAAASERLGVAVPPAQLVSQDRSQPVSSAPRAHPLQCGYSSWPAAPSHQPASHLLVGRMSKTLQSYSETPPHPRPLSPRELS